MHWWTVVMTLRTLTRIPGRAGTRRRLRRVSRAALDGLGPDLRASLITQITLPQVRSQLKSDLTPEDRALGQICDEFQVGWRARKCVLRASPVRLVCRPGAIRTTTDAKLPAARKTSGISPCNYSSQRLL